MGRDALRKVLLGCLGVLELERLWLARVCDVGTSGAPVVVKSVVYRRTYVWKLAIGVQSSAGRMLVSYSTLARAMC